MSSEQSPEGQPSLAQSKYYPTYIEGYTQAYKEDLRGQELLRNILNVSTEQAIDNVSFFSDKETGAIVPHTTIDVNKVFTSLRLPFKNETDDRWPKKQIHIGIQCGWGSDPFNNLDTGLDFVISELVRVQNSGGRAQVYVHLLGTPEGRGGTVTGKLLKQIAKGIPSKEALRPLGRINAALLHSVISERKPSEDTSDIAIRIEGNSAGATISKLTAEEIGAVFDNPRTKRVGRLPLEYWNRSIEASLQISQFNPGNLSRKEFNFQTILPLYNAYKASHSKEYYLRSQSIKEEFLEKVLPKTNNRKQLLGMALIGVALGRGVNTATIDSMGAYIRKGIDNPVGVTPEEKQEMMMVLERIEAQRGVNDERYKFNNALKGEVGLGPEWLERRKKVDFSKDELSVVPPDRIHYVQGGHSRETIREEKLHRVIGSLLTREKHDSEDVSKQT